MGLKTIILNCSIPSSPSFAATLATFPRSLETLYAFSIFSLLSFEPVYAIANASKIVLSATPKRIVPISIFMINFPEIESTLFKRLAI